MSFSCPTEPLKDFMLPLRQKALGERIPLYSIFALTHRCSFRCQHCYLGDQHAIRGHKGNELTTDEVLAILDQIVKAGTLFLVLTGGDPLIRKDFAEIYAHAVRAGLLVTVFCNGSLITDSIVSLWKKYPPHVVEVSMYGATAYTFDNITQVNGSFDLFQQGIERLHHNKIHYRLKTILMRGNSHELEQMEALAENLGVHFRYDPMISPCVPCIDNNGRSNIANPVRKSRSDITFHKLLEGQMEPSAPYQVTGSMLDPLGLRLSSDEILAIDLATESRRQPFLFALQNLPASVEKNDMLYNCIAGRLNCHVSPYGQLTPCVVALDPAIDLRENSFQDSWDSALARLPQVKFQEDDQCYICEYRQICGVCPSLSVLETGNHRLPSATLCDVTKKRFSHLRELKRKKEIYYAENNC